MAGANLTFDLIAKDRASNTFNKVGNSAQRTESRMHKLGAGFAKVGKVAAVGLAVGVAVAARSLFSMGKAAMEDEKAQKLLALQLKNTTGATKAQVGAVEKWISAQGKALGVTDDELRPALSRLAVATGSVKKAQTLASLAMDIATAKGKPLKTVTEALAKAQEGNIGALGRLGVKTKDAAGETKSLDDITKDLAKTYDGAASKAANTAEGKFGRLKVMFDETKESIGAKLLPVALGFADFMLTKFGPAAAKAGAWFQKNLLPPLQAVGNFIKDKVIPAARELGEHVLAGLKKFVDNLSKSMADNKPFMDQAKENFKKVAEIVVTKVIPAIGKVAEWLLPKLGTAIGKMISISRKMINAFLDLSIFGTKSFRMLLTAALNTFSGILHAADKGLGWIPGIGDKIHNAKVAFDKFKDGVLGDLAATEAKLRALKEAINGIPGNKTVHINVVTTSTGAKIPYGPKSGIGLPNEDKPRITPHGTTPRTSGGGTQVVVNFNGLVGDPRALVRQLQKAFADAGLGGITLAP